MPRITIDEREIEVGDGTTVLDAARLLGIEIPTLCHLEGYAPATSCLVCMVKVRGQNRLVPACATRVVEGMAIESETPEVQAVRRAALELLLSDHVGDCLAPCYFACPAHMDVPLMLRQIVAQDLRAAIATVKRDIALPAVLGRICPKPCEKSCRRAGADGAVAVCNLKRFVADADLVSPEPYVPECKPASGKRVAIVGAGPTGLSAAFHLRQDGHAVTIFERRAELGGRLREETSEAELPRSVLDAEIHQVLRLAVEVQRNTQIGDRLSLADLGQQYDAVLVACGTIDRAAVERWGLQAAAQGIEINKETFQTSRPAVFAAGSAIRRRSMVVRSVADGKEAARAIDAYLRGDSVAPRPKPFSVRIGRMEKDEVVNLVSIASQSPQKGADASAEGYGLEDAVQQAARCLHCDCTGRETCKLRRYAAQYGAEPNRYRGPRVMYSQQQASSIAYDPGKCIDCGLCIQIASAAGEPLGLSFVGRGFSVRVGVPFGHSLEEALSRTAAACVAACPTAALAYRAS